MAVCDCKRGARFVHGRTGVLCASERSGSHHHWPGLWRSGSFWGRSLVVGGISRGPWFDTASRVDRDRRGKRAFLERREPIPGGSDENIHVFDGPGKHVCLIDHCGGGVFRFSREKETLVFALRLPQPQRSMAGSIFLDRREHGCSRRSPQGWVYGVPGKALPGSTHGRYGPTHRPHLIFWQQRVNRPPTPALSTQEHRADRSASRFATLVSG